MIVTTGATEGRWGQLIYASFDGGGGPGGWRVKESRGLSPAETEALTARVVTRLDAGPVARFPTPEQVQQMPRRLVYAPALGDSWAYWHSVPAGTDGSGRPGNVFTHVVLDREPGTPADHTRPADRWRSPDWLTPFNAEEVLASKLPAVECPAVRPGTSASAALAFLLDPEWRLGAVSGLLDAVAAAAQGGAPVVLGVRDADRGAAWISAVSHLVPSVVARRLGFSTFERAETVSAAAQAGVALMCVPTDDLDRLDSSLPVAVIAEDELVQVGALGGEPHLTKHGSRIAVTGWSAVASVVFEDETVGLTLLGDMEEVARADTAGAPLGWHLALAVLGRDDVQSGRQEAAAMSLQFSPPAGQDARVVEALAGGITELVGASAERAWGLLAGGPPTGPAGGRAALVKAYLRLAVKDPVWLCRAGGVPFHAEDRRHAIAAVAPEEMAVLLDRTGEAAVTGVVAGGGAARALLVLRLLDLAVRCGWLTKTAESRDLEQAVAGALEGPVSLLLDPGPPASDLARRVGVLDAATREDLLRPVVISVMCRQRGAQSGTVGRRLPPEVVSLLSGASTVDSDDVARVLDLAAPVDPLLSERVAGAWLHDPAAATRDLARAVLVVVSREVGQGSPLPEGLDVDRLVASAGPDETFLGDLREAGADPIPEALLPVMRTAPATAGMSALCQAVHPQAWREGVVPPTPSQRVAALVRLRGSLEADDWYRGSQALLPARRLAAARIWTATVDAAASPSGQVELVDALIVQGQAAWLVAMSLSPGADDALAPSDHVMARTLSGSDAERLLAILGRSDLLAPVGCLALLTDPGSPFMVPESAALAAPVRVQLDGTRPRVVDEVVRRAVHTQGADTGQLVELVTQIAEHVEDALTVWGGGGPQGEGTREAVEAYVRRVAPKQGMFGRFRRG